MIAAALLHPDVSPKVVDRFRSSGIEIKIQDTLDHSTNCSAALIFGGDGTVHRHLSHLHQQKIPMLVVPTGSGNDFARALGIRSVGIALQAWQQFCADGKNVKDIDLGVIRAGGRETLFCCVAGVGMDAEANARANRMPPWLKSRGGYVLAALQSLISFKHAEMSITAEGREIRRSTFFIAVGNALSYGGGMKVTPQATLDDGLLDICLVSKMNKLKLLCWVPTIFFGEHLRLKQVEYFQAGQIAIEAERKLDLYADGDYAGQTPVKIGLMRRGLRVIVPA
ncbi:MAG TPA: YegS/Rv2252/BmrU family lipid kinase [Candidatus Binatia bacterium]|nr:YegS/Rv2252/BmrU family lipid kinase [Candidatus Binatia bacterium]